MNERVEDRGWLTVVETARHFGVGENTIRRWVAEGIIPSTVLGGRRLIPRAGLERIEREAMRRRRRGAPRV